MPVLQSYIYTDLDKGGTVSVNYGSFSPDNFDKKGALVSLLSQDCSLPVGSYSLSWGVTSVTITNQNGVWKGGTSVFVSIPDVANGQGEIVRAETNPLTGGISLSSGSQVLTGTPVMTFAELKTALTAGFVGTAFVSDVGGGTIWVSDGTKAKPIGGTIDIYQSTTSSAFTTSVTRNVGSAVAIPAGLIEVGDTLEVGIFSSKSGATDTGNIQVNLGDSADAVGVQLGGAIASLNYIAATRRCFGIFRFRVDSKTSLTLLNSATGQDGSTSTSAISACVSTVSDLSSAVRYLQITNAMGAGSGDIITIEKLLIRLSK